MPIEISCPCGKRLRAKDELAGKKAKCPGCGTLLQIPLPALPAEEEPIILNDPIEDPLAALAAAQAPAPTSRTMSPSEESADIPIAKKFEPPPVPRAPSRGTSYADMLRASGRAPVTAAPPVQQSEGRRSKATARMVLPTEDTFKGARRFTYLVLLLAMLPLAVATFKSDDDRVIQAFHHTLQTHPDLKRDLELRDDDHLTMRDVRQLVRQTPDDRLDGAFLRGDTWAHWGFALLSAAFFLGTAIFIMPARGARMSQVFLTGLFTGTIGIFLLLVVQFIAAITQNWIMYRGNIFILIIFWLLKFIGFSYRCAMDPSVGFAGSFFGFTLGVGLCEELCKAIPVLYRAGKGVLLDWRTACLCGFLSGVGFGVSEGITYASDYYNGVHGGQIYFVRFISCVALHGVWTAAAGITIFRRQEHLQETSNFADYFFTAAAMVAVPMVLHGLYDTLQKKEMTIAALLIAVASFAYLAYQIEYTHRKEERIIAQMA